MWVFDYKFDEDGYLLKYKARLVVRGDLQEQYGDTYAATLAARLFKAASSTKTRELHTPAWLEGHSSPYRQGLSFSSTC